MILHMKVIVKDPDQANWNEGLWDELKGLMGDQDDR